MRGRVRERRRARRDRGCAVRRATPRFDAAESDHAVAGRRRTTNDEQVHAVGEGRELSLRDTDDDLASPSRQGAPAPVVAIGGPEADLDCQSRFGGFEVAFELTREAPAGAEWRLRDRAG